MSIISKLKSLLGLTPRRRDGRVTTVQVEREPAAETERAVKEPDARPDTAESTEAEPASRAEALDESDEERAQRAAESGSGTESATAAEPTDDRPVETLSGIGPAYAERLADAGVETVGELAAADPAQLAAATGLGEGRISSWIEQAAAE